MKKVVKHKSLRDRYEISLKRKKNAFGSEIYQIFIPAPIMRKIEHKFVDLYVDGLNIILKPCAGSENSFKLCPVGQLRSGCLISASSLIKTEPKLKNYLKYELWKEEGGLFYFKPLILKNEEKS